MFRVLASLVLVAFPLVACSDNPGTTIAINASDDQGNMIAGINGNTGEVSLKIPGFSGNMKLPKLRINAENFDLNGVKLYPGSTVSAMNITGKDGDKDGESEGSVRIAFESPATPETVRAWFQEKLTRQAGFTLQSSGTGLSGTTEEDKPFRLDLTPTGADHASGVIIVGG